MSSKQTIKGVKSGGKIEQTSEGGNDNVTQSIEQSEAEDSVAQKSNSQYLQAGKFKATGLIAVLVLGVIVVVSILYK